MIKKNKYEKALDMACELIGNIILEGDCFGEGICPMCYDCKGRFYCIEKDYWKEYFMKEVEKDEQRRENN